MNTQWIRRYFAFLPLLVMCLAALSAASRAQSVRANWRLAAPFSTYKTYEWVPNTKKDHPFYRQFVDEYVNYALTKKKHLEQVSAAQSPDLLVKYHFLTQEQMDTNTTYWGGGWGGWGMGGWGMGWGGMGMGMGGMGMGGMGMGRAAQTVTRDTVPEGEVAVRRGEQVHATDGDIGHVQGLVIDPSDHHVTHVLLQEGHLWGKKEVAIPISAVTRVDDGIALNIAKQDVAELPSVDIDHPTG